MVTITDEELLEKARVLYKKLGGVGSQDARLVRALIERAGLGSQPTPRAADAEKRAANASRWADCLTESRKNGC
jgi:hypothetical protein